VWEKDPGFVYYDFNKPEELPSELHGTFAMAVIDPPFIIRDVWVKYAQASLNEKKEKRFNGKEASTRMCLHITSSLSHLRQHSTLFAEPSLAATNKHPARPHHRL
jgi:Probable N6-adenine methyltransferase